MLLGLTVHCFSYFVQREDVFFSCVVFRHVDVVYFIFFFRIDWIQVMVRVHFFFFFVFVFVFFFFFFLLLVLWCFGRAIRVEILFVWVVSREIVFFVMIFWILCWLVSFRGLFVDKEGVWIVDVRFCGCCVLVVGSDVFMESLGFLEWIILSWTLLCR